MTFSQIMATLPDDVASMWSVQQVIAFAVAHRVRFALSVDPGDDDSWITEVAVGDNKQAVVGAVRFATEHEAMAFARQIEAWSARINAVHGVGEHAAEA